MSTSSANSDSRERRYNEFVALLARHDLSIRRFIRSLLPSADGVDDVVQETALECWKKFADFQPDDDHNSQNEFVRWACVIARFKALSWHRDHQRDRLVFRETVIQRLADAAIEQIDSMDDQRAAVETCLKSLPEEQRQLVLSIYSPGQSVAAIAHETGQSVRRLYSKLNAVRKQISECVQQKMTTEARHG